MSITTLIALIAVFSGVLVVAIALLAAAIVKALNDKDIGR